jgi:signal transduction histidine kinase
VTVRPLGGATPRRLARQAARATEADRGRADPAIMERVIANLIGNALRYSPPAAPPLVTAAARGGRVEVRVIDHGPGIPAAG